MKRSNLDWETLKEFSCVTLLDYNSSDKAVFEFDENINDSTRLKEFILGNVEYIIGFNSVFFDDIITNYIIENHIKLQKLNGVDVAKQLYKIAQAIINKEDDPDTFQPYKKYSYCKHYTSIDLFLYWSMMLRKSKQLSLKFFAVNLEMNVLEMPIHHTRTNLTKEEKQLVKEYNLNDCEVTKKLAIVLKDEINLRKGIRDEYGLECWSMDAPKIASELLLLAVAKETIDSHYARLVLDGYENHSEEERIQIYIKALRSLKHERPKNIFIKDILPKINFKTDFFQRVYMDMYNAVDDFSRHYLYKNPIITNQPDTFVKLSYGKGGIHSINDNQCYFSDKKLGKRIFTIDAASLYPKLYTGYGYFHRDFKKVLVRVTNNIIEQRLVAKKAKLKVRDKGLKLQLNSLSGLLDQEYSWLYAPSEVLALRLHGQLIISRFIEECSLNNIRLLSANTDGIEVEVYEEQLETLKEVTATISKEFSLIFEDDEYKSIRYLNVNSYIAETVNGKIKQKGFFAYLDERYEGIKVLDGGNEFNIVPIALEKYFVNSIPVEETIRTHNNIYDFCASKKVNKSYNISFNGQEAQQLNRYFISKEGSYLYKQKKVKSKKKIAENQIDLFGDTRKEITVKGNKEAVMKKTPIYLLNEVANKSAQEYPINHQYYISKCNEVINIFESKQTSLV